MIDRTPVEWAMLPLKKYAQFSGRAPRAEYWWFYLATVLAGYVSDKIDGVLSALISLATIVPWLAVTVRRLHDTDRSGWWLLAFLLAVVAAIIMAAFAYGSLAGGPTSYSFTAGILLILVMLGCFVSMLIFMVMPGTQGPNRFGSDPYGPNQLEEIFA